MIRNFLKAACFFVFCAPPAMAECIDPETERVITSVPMERREIDYLKCVVKEQETKMQIAMAMLSVVAQSSDGQPKDLSIRNQVDDLEGRIEWIEKMLLQRGIPIP